MKWFLLKQKKSRKFNFEQNLLVIIVFTLKNFTIYTKVSQCTVLQLFIFPYIDLIISASILNYTCMYNLLWKYNSCRVIFKARFLHHKKNTAEIALPWIKYFYLLVHIPVFLAEKRKWTVNFLMTNKVVPAPNFHFNRCKALADILTKYKWH